MVDAKMGQVPSSPYFGTLPFVYMHIATKFCLVIKRREWEVFIGSTTPRP